MTSHGSMNYSSSDERIILSMAVVSVRNSSGKLISARALVDAGSQLNLKKGGKLNLTGISEKNSLSKSSVNLTVMSRDKSTQLNVSLHLRKK